MFASILRTAPPLAPLFLALLALPAAPAAAPAPGAGPAFSDPLVFTNTFMPFEAGAVKVYAGKSDGESTAVVDLYLDETRTFDLGGTPVECAILQETEFSGGVLSEISRNHFAQADDGSVYYFGEVVDIYEDGAITGHAGSWLVGGASQPSDPPDTADAPAPTVFMPPAPHAGDSWKPEDLMPVVDETVTALDDDASVKVPGGKFTGALRVKETSQLDPGFEEKWYAPGVGFVRSKAKGEKLALIASTLP